ncbi:HAD family hydrolase [uncultured Chitinophaga sp.]|jgi:histidinol-phosphate phosphatase family domain/HAD-superfamily hydrolase, subfamily IIIA|uniref:D-glycero-alpha-D-manno-heptose-1,7-bisphosphate 7-phosphatase n=1 Tax=uncultured Chitinophaga sp. TaxID=339340 RepID=UPI00262E35FE|nr:HAD family hydrolase [uncultured Chitinophaga sp.]
MRKAVFIDKDGTLITDVPYNVNPELIRLEPGAAEALQLLHKHGYALVVVSNQSGIARGYFEDKAMQAVKDRIAALLSLSGIQLDGFFYCPHHPQGSVKAYAIDCVCRKPHPGLLLQAASLLNIDLQQSWMIGDILHDVEAGNRAGCRTVLLDNGHETEWIINSYRKPLLITGGLLEAAQLIISN